MLDTKPPVVMLSIPTSQKWIKENEKELKRLTEMLSGSILMFDDDWSFKRWVNVFKLLGKISNDTYDKIPTGFIGCTIKVDGVNFIEGSEYGDKKLKKHFKDLKQLFIYEDCIWMDNVKIFDLTTSLFWDLEFIKSLEKINYSDQYDQAKMHKF